MFSYSTGYYVSPPVDQYLKFKNRCSLLYMYTICKKEIYSPNSFKYYTDTVIKLMKESEIHCYGLCDLLDYYSLLQTLTTTLFG